MKTQKEKDLISLIKIRKERLKEVANTVGTKYWIYKAIGRTINKEIESLKEDLHIERESVHVHEPNNSISNLTRHHHQPTHTKDIT